MHEAEALEALRTALPLWVVWLAPVGWVLFGAVFAALVTWVPLRVARAAVARARDAHWTERARQRWPLVMTARLGTVTAVVFAAVFAFQWTGPLSPIPARVVATLAAAVAYASAVWTADFVVRPVAERVVGWAALLRLLVANWTLMQTSLFVAFLALAVIPLSWDVAAWLVLLGAVVLYLWLMTGGCVPLLQAVGVIGPATETERRLAAEVADALGRPAPVVRRLRVPVANAMALILHQSLLITGPAREVLDDAELRAVLAHEVGHLMESRRAMVRRVLMGMLPLALPAAVPLGMTYGPLWALLPLVAMFLMVFLLRHVSLRHETEADSVAHAHEGEDGVEDGAYARALAAIYRFNLSPAVSGAKLRTHPDLYDRLLAAGVEPDYPRPEPPPKRRALRLLGFAVMLVVAFVAALIPVLVEGRGWSHPDAIEPALAATGGRAWLFERYGWIRHAAGDDDHALLAARAARQVAPGDARLGLAVVSLLGECGAADEARSLFERLSAEHPAAELTSVYLAVDFAERARVYGDPDDLDRWLSAATDLLDRDGGADARLITRLGRLRHASGGREQARALLERAVGAASAAPADDAWLCADVALLARSLGDDDRAATWLERALLAAAEGGFLADLAASVEARSTRDE